MSGTQKHGVDKMVGVKQGLKKHQTQVHCGDLCDHQNETVQETDVRWRKIVGIVEPQ